MKDVTSVGVIGMGFVYCKDCLGDALEALNPLIHFFLLPASGNWHCETCVWADLDEGNLYCCESGLGRHKTEVTSEFCESDEEIEGAATPDIWAKAKAAICPCRGYHNERRFELRAYCISPES